MKYKNLKIKSLVCLGLVLMLFASMAISAMAFTSPEPTNANAVNWQLSDDGKTLTGNGVKYDLYTLPSGVELFDGTAMYYYQNTVTWAGKTYDVRSYAKAGYVVWLINRYDSHAPLRFYVMEGHEEDLASFAKDDADMKTYAGGLFERNVQIPQNGYVKLSTDAAASLEMLAKNEQSDKGTIDVTTLQKLDRVQILGLQNDTKALAKVLGDLYFFDDGQLGYVSYAQLDNSHFDADGYFSYRKGSVTVYTVDSTHAKQLKHDIENAVYYSPQYNYEAYEGEQVSPDVDTDYDYTQSTVKIFWITFVFLGYLLPIAPLVIGLIFALGNKMSHPRRWFVVSGLSGAWLLLSIILTIIFLI